MASIRKRGNNYFIDYRINGKRVRKSVGPSKEQAEEALHEIKQSLKAGKSTAPRLSITLKDLFVRFLEHCQEHTSQNTQIRYRSILGNFQRFLEKQHPSVKKASQCTRKIIADYFRFRQYKGTKSRTINAELVVLRRFFSLAVEWGVVSQNPTDGVKPLSIDKKKAPRVLSEDECKTLLTKADNWLHPILVTFLHTGLSKSELEHLKWEDIDFEDRRLHVAGRTIPINEKLLQILQTQVYRTKTSDYVFPDENGQRLPASRLRNEFIKLADRCGLHDVKQLSILRHTFAAQLVKKGVSLQTVQKLLGHTSLASTMVYALFANRETDDNGVDRLEF